MKDAVVFRLLWKHYKTSTMVFLLFWIIFIAWLVAGNEASIVGTFTLRVRYMLWSGMGKNVVRFDHKPNHKLRRTRRLVRKLNRFVRLPPPHFLLPRLLAESRKQLFKCWKPFRPNSWAVFLWKAENGLGAIKHLLLALHKPPRTVVKIRESPWWFFSLQTDLRKPRTTQNSWWTWVRELVHAHSYLWYDDL